MEVEFERILISFLYLTAQVWAIKNTLQYEKTWQQIGGACPLVRWILNKLFGYSISHKLYTPCCFN